MVTWPVYTYLAIQLIGLGIALAKHGDDIKINFFSTLITTLFTFFLLYKGGFFNCIL